MEKKMKSDSHKKMTQKYSTWGDKLLQHTDVLNSIQNNKKFKPITIQLAPLEACNSDCPFCSVAARPIKNYMPFDKIKKVLLDFKELGAKSVEITGGGNPMLYKDRKTKEDINDIIEFAHELQYDIGIITNSHKLIKIKKENHAKINWIRISLIMLDEGVNPEDYNFNGFPYNKLGFSYIIYDGQKDVKRDYIKGNLSKSSRVYPGTSAQTIEKMARLIELHPKSKFVRIAGNCLIKGHNAEIRDKYFDIISSIDKHNKFFIKDIGYDDTAFDEGCYVGLIRPYIASHPHEKDNYQVYICTSHVLNKRNYDLEYSLGSIDDIKQIWGECNDNFRNGLMPYNIKCNTVGWSNKCDHCFYKNNNKLLHSVSNDIPDKNFP